MSNEQLREEVSQLRAELRNRQQNAAADSTASADDYQRQRLETERDELKAQLAAFDNGTAVSSPPPPREPDSGTAAGEE